MYSVFFFFKQKTAYEMRISDWSSDVCSSDLLTDAAEGFDDASELEQWRARSAAVGRTHAVAHAGNMLQDLSRDRKSVVEGKSVSVRVDLGGRRIIKKKNNKYISSTRHKTNE